MFLSCPPGSERLATALHQMHHAQSGHSRRNALDTFSTLRVFAHEPIREQDIEGCGMGPWLVLVSLCFRENVVATWKIGSFLCTLDNLLQKNVIVFFFLEIKFQNGAHLKNKGYF